MPQSFPSLLSCCAAPCMKIQNGCLLERPFTNVISQQSWNLFKSMMHIIKYLYCDICQTDGFYCTSLSGADVQRFHLKASALILITVLMEEDTYKCVSRGFFNVSRLLNITDGGDICSIHPYMKMSQYACSVEMFYCGKFPF